MTQALLAVPGRGVLAPDTAIVRADDAGITRGDGCFEGIRVVVDPGRGAHAAKLDRHLARMARSAASLRIPFDAAAWGDLVTLACAEWTRRGGDEAAMKLVLTRGPADGGPTCYLTITPLSAEYPRLRRDGLRVATLTRGLTADAFADAPWLLGGVKTLSYAVNMAAVREAERRGADDVVFVSADGYVLEAPTGTVVWATGRTLHTIPTGDTGILPGTTQQLLFEQAGPAGWLTAETPAHVDDLHAADVVWLISSVRGPIDVVDLDGTARTRRPEIDAEIRGLCGF